MGLRLTISKLHQEGKLENLSIAMINFGTLLKMVNQTKRISEDMKE
jgi:preprotein translocase subunit SecB